MRSYIFGSVIAVALAGVVFGYADASVSANAVAMWRNAMGVAVFTAGFAALLGIQGRISDILSTAFILVAVFVCWFVTNQTVHGSFVPSWFAQSVVQAGIVVVLVILWVAELFEKREVHA